MAEIDKMKFDIRWVVAQYHVRPSRTQIAVQEPARARLEEMGRELGGKSGHVAIYIPLKTGRDRRMLGRIGSVIRLLEMPEESTCRDFGRSDDDHSTRWPYGWPCEVISAPEPTNCPFLEPLICEHLARTTFQEFTHQLHIQGPVRLAPRLQSALNAIFDRVSTSSITEATITKESR